MISLVGVPLLTLMLELGHESLAVTQDYLADVRKLRGSEESRRARRLRSQGEGRKRRARTAIDVAKD